MNQKNGKKVIYRHKETKKGNMKSNRGFLPVDGADAYISGNTHPFVISEHVLEKGYFG